MAQFDSSLVCDFVGDEFEPVVGLVPSRIDVGDFDPCPDEWGLGGVGRICS